jgi:HlyD family secretion protein
MKRLVSSPVGRVLMALALLAVVVGGAAYVWTQRGARQERPLQLYGNVDIREVQLGFRQPGRVLQMKFDEGDFVHAGTLMATIDPEPYRQALAEADAAVGIARAELAKLKAGPRPQEITQAREALRRTEAASRDAARNYERQNNLLASGASSARTVDAARSAHDQAAAAVVAARAALSQAVEGFRKEDIAAGAARLAAAESARERAATALADTRLVAPSDGTVIARVRESGSMVTSQSTVYSLSLGRPIYVRAYVGEPDLGRIAPGTAVRVRTDTSNKVYRGRIGFISPRAEFTPKTVETTDLRTDLVYRLRIVIDEAESDAALRQGMPVTITLDAPPGSAAPTGKR